MTWWQVALLVWVGVGLLCAFHMRGDGVGNAVARVILWPAAAVVLLMMILDELMSR